MESSTLQKIRKTMPLSEESCFIIRCNITSVYTLVTQSQIKLCLASKLCLKYNLAISMLDSHLAITINGWLQQIYTLKTRISYSLVCNIYTAFLTVQFSKSDCPAGVRTSLACSNLLLNTFFPSRLSKSITRESLTRFPLLAISLQKLTHLHISKKTREYLY